MLLGILASYLKETKSDAKILVLEPNECLAYHHKKLYCHSASNIEPSQFANEPGIWYCTHKDFLNLTPGEAGELPSELYVLVDEADIFFQSFAFGLTKDLMLENPLDLLMKATKVIGFSATFGGKSCEK